MKFASIALLAACVPAVVTDAKLRGKFKKNKLADLKKVAQGSSSSSSADEEPDLKRKLYEKTLNVVGLGPDEKLSSAEILYLEDLVKKNLNVETADSPFEPEAHHALLFTEIVADERRLFGGPSFIDIKVYDEYTCKYCPDDEDDWRPPNTRAPTETEAPSASPSQAPSVDIKDALKEADIGNNNLCAGAKKSPFFRLRKISSCSFS
ncbi:MAG: hypothetical protein SGARI_003082 [Bacillariaceae sp.]